MPSRLLLPHQTRALAAAAGLVGRPRLRASLAVTLAACGPEFAEPGASAGETFAASTSSATTGVGEAASTGDTSTGSASTGLAPNPTDASTSDATTGATLLTDASGTGDSTGDATGDATGGTTGGSSSGGELSDCVDPNTGRTDWACCEAQGWEPFPQCTPWGPPAPPSAARALLTRARAARRALA